ncbi:unnamed protein product [Brassica oleracea var. botrytis]
MGVDLRNKPNLFPLRFTSNMILFIRCFPILIVKFLCRFNLTMAQTNADDDLKSKSLKAEFASVNSVGNKQEELWSQFLYCSQEIATHKRITKCSSSEKV